MPRRSLLALIAGAVLFGAWFFPQSEVRADYPELSKPPEVEKTGAKDVAVIFAIGDYVFLPDVEGVTQTANDWENFFVRGLGVPSSRVFVKTDGAGTREKMLAFAKRAAKAAEPGGRVWFVFVGHGAPTKSGKDGLLVGVDAQSEPASLEARGVKRGELLDALEAGEQKDTVVVIDACFSGKTNDGQALAKGMQPVVPTAIQSAPRDKSTLVLSAAKANQFAGALPGESRPAFSYLLLGALRGWADDGDGEVTAQEAVYWAKRQMRQLEHSQEPEVLGDNDTVLTTGASANDPGIAGFLRRKGQPAKGGSPETTKSRTASSEGECPHGKERSPETDGHCCWSGQVWSGSSCVGMPSCPSGYRLDDVSETCELPECVNGAERAKDGIRCCWPGQALSTAGLPKCVGMPDACKRGNAEGCYEIVRVYAQGFRRENGTWEMNDWDGSYEMLPGKPYLSWELLQRILKSACNAGEPKACFELAMRLEAREIPEMMTYLQSACDGGLGEACSMMGRALRYGRDKYKPHYPRKNKERAQAYHRRACQDGLALDCVRVAELIGYENAGSEQYLKNGCEELGSARACASWRTHAWSNCEHKKAKELDKRVCNMVASDEYTYCEADYIPAPQCSQSYPSPVRSGGGCASGSAAAVLLFIGLGGVFRRRRAVR